MSATTSTSQVVLRAERLGKRYTLGGGGGAGMLREALMALPRRLLARTAPPTRDVWALRDCSFELRRGEVLGIIGPNGAGKSTLLKVIARITRPTEGFVEVDGRVGSLLEVGTGFHPELTGNENILLGGVMLGMTRRDVLARLGEIVEFSGVDRAFLDTPVKHYSSGMQMRLAFAVAAHLEPDILIVDEVLAVGDAQFQERCLGRMDQVARAGRTVLFVSHNMSAVRRLCSRALVLGAGRTDFDGSATAAVEHYFERLRAADDRGDPARLRCSHSELVAWSLACPDGSPLRPRESARLTFTVRAIERLSSPSLFFQLYDREGQLLFGLHSIHGTRVDGVEPGSSLTFRFDLPRLPLNPGCFTLQVWLLNHSGPVTGDIQPLQQLLRLSVAEGAVYGDVPAPILDKYYGRVAVEAEVGHVAAPSPRP